MAVVMVVVVVVVVVFIKDGKGSKEAAWLAGMIMKVVSQLVRKYLASLCARYTAIKHTHTHTHTEEEGVLDDNFGNRPPVPI